RDYPDSPLKPRADFWGARAYFDLKDDAHGCPLIQEALAGPVGGADVEFKNQVSFYAARCTNVTPTATSAVAESQPKAASNAGAYAVQVLAVKSAATVDDMLTRLKVMGFDARVVRDTSGLFKVRVGRYARRDGAQQVQRRRKPRTGGPAGGPVKAGTEYLRRLIAKGHRVAICEQVEDPKLAKGLVRREVVETITPGTVLAEDWLERKRNNFLVALDPRGPAPGLAALDLS